MITKKQSAHFLAFWQQFSKDPLYGTGFADAVQSCAADRPETWGDEKAMIRALSFLAGYAQACRLACDYMTPRWHVAHILSCAAGCQLSIAMDTDSEPASRPVDCASLCHTWTAELTHDIERFQAQ